MKAKLLPYNKLEYRSVDLYDFQLHSERWKEKKIEDIISFSITKDELSPHVAMYAQELSHVQHLKISASSKYEKTLTKIPEEIKHFKNLQLLEINSEHIEQLPDVFEYFPFLKWLTIHCGEESIKCLPASLYQQGKLQTLSLQNISQIDFEEICEKHTALQSLSIFNCNLTAIPASIQKLSKLKSLYLYDNPIAHFPQEISTLTLLTDLILKGAKIKSIDEKLIHLNLLSYLDLSNNQLEKIPFLLFEGFPKLKILHLSGNQIEEIVPENREISIQNSLQEVYLAYNKLKTLPSFLLTNFPQLKELYLQGNQIENIPDVSLEKNKITRIQLDDNALQVFPQALFKQLHKIQFFHLNNNQIRLLPNDLLSLAKSKKTRVLLKNNQITHFSEEIIQYLKQDNKYDTALDLEGNPALTLLKEAQNTAYQERRKAQEENKTCVRIGHDAYSGSGVLPEEHPLYGRISFLKKCPQCKSSQIFISYASFSVHTHSGDVYWDYNYTCQDCSHTDASSYAENN